MRTSRTSISHESWRANQGLIATHDSPIRQPLHIISSARALERLERKVGRHDPSEDGGEEAGGDVEEDEDGKEGGEAEDAVGFGDLGLLFEPLQSRVLRQLCANGIELNQYAIRVYRYEPIADAPPCRFERCTDSVAKERGVSLTK